MNRLLASLVTLLFLSGCHKIRFDVSPNPSPIPITERKSYYLFGLTPTRHIDLATHCPKGTAAVVEETTVGDRILGLITLGIYTPRTTHYYCVVEGL